MRKFSLLIALALLITVGGVYANWVYLQNADVADITSAKAITITEAVFTNSQGAYHIDVSKVSLTVDPKPGTTYTTALIIDGYITITFTPNQYASPDVKNYGLKTYFSFSSSNSNWKYESEDILTLVTDQQTIGATNGSETRQWTKQGDGTFVYTIEAEDLADYINLTKFELDTKTKYDNYDAVLPAGQIVISVGDGVTTGGSASE